MYFFWPEAVFFVSTTHVQSLLNTFQCNFASIMSKDAGLSSEQTDAAAALPPEIQVLQYSLDHEPKYLPQMRQLIGKDLSEPYSIYVYRYFLYQWPELCFMAVDTTNSSKLAGVVICKLEQHRGGPMRGYIAMLATQEAYRGKGVATTLVMKAIDLMIEKDADEIALETEETNNAAMRLYEKLGFLRSKKLYRYYLNGNSAYRLLLYLKPGVGQIPTDFWDDELEQGEEGPSASSKDFLDGSGIV